jgi:hypothetical protein
MWNLDLMCPARALFEDPPGETAVTVIELVGMPQYPSFKYLVEDTGRGYRIAFRCDAAREHDELFVRPGPDWRSGWVEAHQVFDAATKCIRVYIEDNRVVRRVEWDETA